MSLIECKDLCLGYEGNVIVHDVNFTVERGDYLCIVGENGSGKSTLMKTILGLKSKLGGSITYGDGLKAGAIGYLPQQTAAQKDFPASATEVVMSGFAAKSGIFSFYSKEQKQTARKNMEKLSVLDLADKCYRELSGGQQQRVLLARALCASSELLVLDEPVSGLDPIVTAELYSVINELNKDGLTVIMISHDIHSAIRYASHVLHVSHTPLFFGRTEDYLKSDVCKAFTETANSAILNSSSSINDNFNNKEGNGNA